MIPRLPFISCHSQNHQSMPFEFVCMNSHCLKNSQELACVYCCQQFHKHHISNIKAIKEIIVEVYNSKIDTEYEAADILLKGISTCQNEKDLRQNLSELICYKDGGKKYEKILDMDMKIIKNKTKQFYERQKEKLSKTIKKKYKGECTETPFISPIFTFCEDEAEQYGFSFKSPFCISNPSEKLTTAFANPPLTKFVESVSVSVKVERITPFWLGIGVSLGKQRYEDGSKRHVMLTSNGWVSNFGKLEKTNVKYCMKDRVLIKWDKSKELLEMISGGEKHTLKIKPQWNEQLFLCVAMFYKDDSVQIIS